MHDRFTPFGKLFFDLLALIVLREREVPNIKQNRFNIASLLEPDSSDN